MYNLKYTLAMEPTSNPNKFNVGIYANASQVVTDDTEETPRGQRICEATVLSLVNESNELVKDPKKAWIFRGFDNEIPSSYFKVMETNIRIKWSRKTKFMKVQNGDFKRYTFDGKLTGAISLLQNYTTGIYNQLKDIEKFNASLTNAERVKFEKFSEGCLANGEKFPTDVWDRNGRLKREKVRELINFAD